MSEIRLMIDFEIFFKIQNPRILIDPPYLAADLAEGGRLVLSLFILIPPCFYTPGENLAGWENFGNLGPGTL